MKLENENYQRQKLQELLRQVRKRNGFRQVELAQKLDVPQSFISKYEIGERRLDILELRQICILLNMSLNEFIQELEENLNEAQ